jgi:hypothetical protein
MLVAKAKRKEKIQVVNNGCGVYLCVDFLFPFFAVIGGLQRLLSALQTQDDHYEALT